MFMYSICVKCVIMVVLPLSFPLPSLATLFSLSSSLLIVCFVTLFSLSLFSFPSLPPSLLPSLPQLRSLFSSQCSLNVVHTLWDLYLTERDPFLIFFLALVMVINAKYAKYFYVQKFICTLYARK